MPTRPLIKWLGARGLLMLIALAAARLAGIPLSSWVRERLRLAAIRDLESAGQKIPFVKPIHLGE